MSRRKTNYRVNPGKGSADPAVREARLLFSLSEDFTPEELLRSYRRKLFETHPDTATEATMESSGLRVTRLLEARDVLEAHLKRSGAGLQPGTTEPAARTDQPAEERRGPAGEDGYNWYRQANGVYSDALEQYWRERLKWSEMPEDTPQYLSFRKQLERARGLFAAVLGTFPGGIWTPDAVEQIARINIWLGYEGGSLAE